MLKYSIRGYSLSVEHQLPKLNRWVRLPLSAPAACRRSQTARLTGCVVFVLYHAIKKKSGVQIVQGVSPQPNRAPYRVLGFVFISRIKIYAIPAVRIGYVCSRKNKFAISIDKIIQRVI